MSVNIDAICDLCGNEIETRTGIANSTVMVDGGRLTLTQSEDELMDKDLCDHCAKKVEGVLKDSDLDW